MSTTQAWMSRATLGGGNGSVWTGVIAAAQNTSSQVIAQPLAAGGTLKNWVITITNAPGSGKSQTFTVRKNGSNTALTITISNLATSGSDISHTVSIAAGDTIDVIQNTSGSPSAGGEMKSVLEFEPTNAGDCVFGWHLPSSQFGATRPPVGFTENGTVNHAVLATGGTITKFYVKSRTAPGTAGSGKAFIFALVKNGVTQDGTGGTVDTRAQIVDTATTANSTFSLSMAAGDTIAFVSSSANSPTGATYYSGSFLLQPTSPSQMPTLMTGNLNTSSTNYIDPVASSRLWSGVESGYQMPGGVTSQYFTAIYVKVGTAPAVGTTRTYTLNKNGNPTALTVTLGAGVGNNSATISPGVTIATGDLWSIVSTCSGVPNNTSSSVSFGTAAPTAGPLFQSMFF